MPPLATAPLSRADMFEQRLSFLNGTVIGGKFRIERVISEGGMGLVVAATHLGLDQLVALKFFRPDVGSDRKTLFDRFTREAKAAARLKSEHVARVIDVVVTDEGLPYMVIEYLDGQSLDVVLKQRGPMTVRSVADYAIQACDGLAEAHARGIVHRDISPANLFLVNRGNGQRSIKILDFGISKFAMAEASNVATNIIMGTPCYMSPEQIRSTANVDHRADIWSLGATVYELLAGRTAFDSSKDLLALAESIVYDAPAPLRSLRPDVPEALEAVILRCLSKKREDRFKSAGDLAMQLLRFAGPGARVPAERAFSMTPAATMLSGTASTGQVEDAERTPGPRRALAEGSLSESSSSPPKASLSRGLAVATASAALICVVSWSAATLLSKRRPRERAVAGASTRVQAPRTVATAPTLNDLMIRVSPPTARLALDGVAVAGNPFHSPFAAGGKHDIEASADGFETKREQVTLSKDTVVEIVLDRRPGRDRGERHSVATGRSPSAATSRTARPSGTKSLAARLPPVVVVESPPPAAARRSLEVDPAGGREPLRPIDVRNPYGSQ